MRNTLLVPVLFALALTLPGAWREGFLHEDEWRNAVMVREMAARGFDLHPRLHGTPYPDYPPLYFWTACAVAKPFGASPFAVRFPSIVGAALLAFGTALLALRLGSSKETALAAGVLVSVIPALHYEERRAMIDPLFSGLVCVSVALLAKASRPSFAGGCSFLVLAWLAKGPLGAAVIGLALLGGEALRLTVEEERDWPRLRLQGELLVLFVLLVAAGWYALAYRLEGQEYGDNLLYQQTWGRFAPELNPQHQHDWKFYLKTTLPALLPIGAFAIPPRSTRTGRFGLGWFLLVFVFFTISNTKRTYYPMPAYPAVALMAAGFFERRLQPGIEEIWRRAMTWSLAGGAVLAVLVALFGPELPEHGFPLKAFGRVLVFALVAALLVFEALATRGKRALALAAASGLVLAAVSATFLPVMERRHGQKYLAQKLQGIEHFAVSPGGVHREALCFFFGPSPVDGTDNVESHTSDKADPKEVKRWLRRFEPGKAACIVLLRDVEGVTPPFGDPELVFLAKSDDEDAAEAYVAIGLRH